MGQHVSYYLLALDVTKAVREVRYEDSEGLLRFCRNLRRACRRLRRPRRYRLDCRPDEYSSGDESKYEEQLDELDELDEGSEEEGSLQCLLDLFFDTFDIDDILREAFEVLDD